MMECPVFLCVCLSFFNLLHLSSTTQSGSVFPDRSTPPGLKATYKVWWAKEITPDFHVAGRLTERQIKYAGEAGFRSILSLFTYHDDEAGDFGGDYLPTTKEAKKIVENVAGLQFVTLLGPDDDWASVDAVQKLTAVMPKLKKPVLLHCNRGYTIAFVTLMYLANETCQDPNFKPHIDSEKFYEISAAMGLDFTMDFTKEVVAEITGEPIVEHPPTPKTEPEEWLDYWLVHPVYKNWYTAGQILKSHIAVMEEVGFKVVINVRPGLTLKGTPAQEEVNLLNIKERTGTYATSKQLPRQSRERLEETRIDPKRPNSYICEDSPVNYEMRNPEEFGDDVGYSEKLEAAAMKNSSLKYYHIPMESRVISYKEYFKENMGQLLEAGRHGPINLHCARGARAAYIAVLVAAVQYDKDLDWAFKKTSELGFPVTEAGTPDLFAVYEEWLMRDTNKGHKVKVEL